MSNSQTDSRSSSSRFGRAYDVYINYCTADDTVVDFVDRLYAAFDREGICAFRDDEASAPQQLNAIENSRFVIVILSINYAQSTRCLDELAKASECMKNFTSEPTVVPVFYDVKRSEVWRQFENLLGEAFPEPTLKRWKAALDAAIRSRLLHTDDGNEVELFEDIIDHMSQLSMRPYHYRPNVGIDRRLEELMELCFGIQDSQADGVRFIGIYGMGGIGKTTLAEAFYERVYNWFEDASFLVNVREISNSRGIIYLQEKLHSDLMNMSTPVHNKKEGENLLRDRLHNKKVLIVIDDADEEEQLEALAGSRDWFGSGSRIIITSRDERLLQRHEVDAVYKPNDLDSNEALELFCFKAFGMDHPLKSYMQLSLDFVNYAKGLPLAITILGSSLDGKSKEAWKTTFIKLQSQSDRTITSVLRVSFDGLDFEEKEIFLDIACFFKGKEKDWVTEIFKSLGFSNSLMVIHVLVDKSLVTQVGSKLWIHDLLQKMGWQIVREEWPNVPGRHSRLWLSNDIIDVLESNQGTDALQSIALDLRKPRKVICHTEAFCNMRSLRFLQIRNVHMTEGPRYLSHELKYLEWSGYPTKSLPQNFNPYKLAELNLCHSSIEQLWNGKKDLPHLKVINVSFSSKLTMTPDLASAPRLEQLILEGCTSLVKIHPSIAVHKRLTCLNLKNCRSLRILPSKFEMESLEILILSGCLKVRIIPEFGDHKSRLLELCLDETAIEQLPSSVALLTDLALLSLKECKKLKSLPRDVGNLKLLKHLNISGCSELETLPDSLGEMDILEKLDASGSTIISDLPLSMSRLKVLQVLSVRGCKGISGKMTRNPLGFLSPITTNSGGLRFLTELNLSDCSLQEGTLPEDLGCLSSLVSLNLSKNGFVSLPESIRQLSKLHNLNLESCKSLQVLSDLSSSINFSTQERLSSSFNLISCSKLVVKQSSNNIAFSMLYRFLQGVSYAGTTFETIIPGTEISEVFSDQSVGPVVSMELLQQWHSSKWKGYALCAVFHISRGLQDPANRLGKMKLGTHSSAHGLRCEVKPNNLGVGGWCPSFVCSQELGEIESEHLWLSFVCGDYFGTTWQKSCRNIEFTFKTLGTGMEVKKCGVRLIYEQDLDLLGKK